MAALRTAKTTENQRRELEAVAARSGWEVIDIYEDAGISGSNGAAADEQH
jgi:DNA invertase Pin-like site-specific DNA recombinase